MSTYCSVLIKLDKISYNLLQCYCDHVYYKRNLNDSLRTTRQLSVNQLESLHSVSSSSSWKIVWRRVEVYSDLVAGHRAEVAGVESSATVDILGGQAPVSPNITVRDEDSGDGVGAGGGAGAPRCYPCVSLEWVGVSGGLVTQGAVACLSPSNRSWYQTLSQRTFVKLKFFAQYKPTDQAIISKGILNLYQNRMLNFKEYFTFLPTKKSNIKRYSTSCAYLWHHHLVIKISSWCRCCKFHCWFHQETEGSLCWQSWSSGQFQWLRWGIVCSQALQCGVSQHCRESEWSACSSTWHQMNFLGHILG